MKKSLKKYIITGIFLITGILTIVIMHSNTKVYADGEHIHPDNESIKYTAWTDATSLPTSEGHYYLENDVTLASTFEVTKDVANDVTICLNGHGIKMTGQGNVFKITGGELEITDCSDLEHKYKTLENGLAQVDDSLTENYETFKGGYITGGNGVETGGAFYVNGGQLIIRRALIIGNSTTGNGGAIYVEKTSNLTVVEKSYIIGNVAEKSAGGIYNADSSKPIFVRDHSTIKNNFSKTSPAGIYSAGKLSLGEVNFKDELYIYDNKLSNGDEDDIVADGEFVISSAFNENSKIGYSNIKNGIIIDYYKAFRVLSESKYVDLYNNENPNAVLISNSNINLVKSENNAVYEYNALDYVVAYDEEMHTFKPDSNYKIEHTIKYGNVQDTYDLETAPEFSEIGEHIIYYEVKVGDIVVKKGSQKITITDIDPHMPTGNKNLIYTGNAQELITVTEYPGISYNYKLRDGYWSTYIPKGIDAGTYTIYVRIYGDTEHGEIEQSVKATIVYPDKTSLIAKIDEATAYRDEINENYKKIAADLNKEILLARTKEIIDVVTADEIKTAEDDLDAALTKAKEDVSSVNAVIDLIDAIGDVAFNDESKAKIDAARAAYDALIEIYKVHVSNYETLTNAEGLYESLKSDDEAAKSVIAAIDSIGEVTLDSKSKIDEVKLAYNVLTDSQKALVTNYETLTNAENTYLKMSASKDLATPVENEINDIGIVYLNEESKAKIDSARVAYDALADDVKPFVSNYETLTSAEARYEELVNNSNLAKAVEDAINAIGEVTIDSKDKIESARTSYDALNDEQKMLVLNLEVLTTAEAKFAVILINKGKAEAVDAKIDEIGAVTYTDECKEKIDTAKASYNILTAEQKAFVTKLETLTNAEKKYTNVDYAYKVINSIGSVELTDEFRTTLNNARNIYDALTDDEKALITNLNRLTNAEADYQQLSSQRTANFLLIVGIVGGVLLLIILVIVYVLFFFVFNSWTLIKYKKKRVFRIGTKNGKVRLLCRNFKIIYRDEADIFKHND